MTEVKRYHLTETGLVEGESLGRLSVVLAADYDSVVEHVARLEQLNVLGQETVTLALETTGRLVAERDALQQRLTAADERVDVLESALKFYADGDHLLLADPDAWDTCSGEPINFLHDDAGTASVEDGSIAKAALGLVEIADPCACIGCEASKVSNSLFCADHQSAKSRTRSQDPITAEGLAWMMQRDGEQQ